MIVVVHQYAFLVVLKVRNTIENLIKPDFELERSIYCFYTPEEKPLKWNFDAMEEALGKQEKPVFIPIPSLPNALKRWLI